MAIGSMATTCPSKGCSGSTISDDGCGLPSGDAIQQAVARGHFGLAGMHERAKLIGATLAVQSVRDYGTAVILTMQNSV